MAPHMMLQGGWAIVSKVGGRRQGPWGIAEKANLQSVVVMEVEVEARQFGSRQALVGPVAAPASGGSKPVQVALAPASAWGPLHHWGLRDSTALPPGSVILKTGAGATGLDRWITCPPGPQPGCTHLRPRQNMVVYPK